MDSTSLADIAPVIMLESDLDGRIRRANAYLEDVTGFSPGSIVGRDWLDELVVEQDRALVARALDEAMVNGSARGIVYGLHTRDGGRREVQSNVRVITDHDGRPIGMLTVGIDVTDRVIEEQRTRGREVLLAEAQRMTRVGSWQRDLKTDEAWWSDAMWGLLEVPPGEREPAASVYYEFVHPEDVGALDRNHRTAVETGTAFSNRHRLVMTDGRVKRVEAHVAVERDSTGAPWIVRGTMQDITERVQLDRQVELKDVAIDNAATPIAIGGPDNHLIYANPAFLVAWGADDFESVTGILLPELYDHASESREQATAAYLARRPWSGEVVARRLDGSTFPAWLSTTMVADDSGTMANSVYSFVDLTDRVEADRIKSEFFSTVSHELRTPLTSIDGALRLVTGGVVGPITDLTRQYLTAALRNSRRLTRLIDQLLISEQIAAGQFTIERRPHELPDLIEEVIEAHQAYGVHRDVRVELRGVVPDVVVDTDSERFVQVLSNLLSNAIKFSPDGSVVEVAVSVDTTFARTDIIDRGPGIPEAFRSRVFERFTQVDASDDRAQSGTGLGLSIARALTEQIGGRISVESVEGQGSTFSVEVPLWRCSTDGTPSNGGTGGS